MNSYCKECGKKYAKAYRDNPDNKEHLLMSRRLRRFGLKESEFQTMLMIQCGKCDICQIVFDPDDKIPHIDHDHSSLVVRGLLCDLCNKLLGMAKDDPAVLGAAIEYLNRHR